MSCDNVSMVTLSVTSRPRSPSDIDPITVTLIIVIYSRVYWNICVNRSVCICEYWDSRVLLDLEAVPLSLFHPHWLYPRTLVFCSFLFSLLLKPGFIISAFCARAISGEVAKRGIGCHTCTAKSSAPPLWCQALCPLIASSRGGSAATGPLGGQGPEGAALFCRASRRSSRGNLKTRSGARVGRLVLKRYVLFGGVRRWWGRHLDARRTSVNVVRLLWLVGDLLRPLYFPWRCWWMLSVMCSSNKHI